jgi:hypothetical protein
MSNFLLSFHGGAPGATEEERDASQERWGAWFVQIEESIVDAGDGVAPLAFISPNGDVMRDAPSGDDASKAVTGYTVITADDLDAALEIAKACPILKDGGSIEVGEILGLMVETAEVDELEVVTAG